MAEAAASDAPIVAAAPPAPVGPYAPNTLLSRVDRLDLGHFAPEDIVVDAQGNIYGGTIDGKIMRLDPSGKNPLTAMPPLAPERPASERQLMARQIYGYLRAVGALGK